MSKRRCRHFDPREAGAAVSLRSDRGVSTTGSHVDSWTSTAGSVVANGSSSSRPQFIASSASFGGFPALEFDGSNDVLDMTATAAGVFQNVGQGRIFVVTRNDGGATAGSRLPAYWSNGTSATLARLAYATHAATTSTPYSFCRRLDADALTFPTLAQSTAAAHIGEAVANYSSGTTLAVFNGVAGSPAALPSGSGNSSNTASLAASVGSSGGTNVTQGPITQITAFNTTIDDALAARIRHCSARTFLIPSA